MHRGLTVEYQYAGGTSLKESLVSRAFWRDFFAYAQRKSPFRAFFTVSSFCSWIADFVPMSITVFLFEVVEPFFSLAAAPLHIPS